ncbi:Integral membrane protein GPR137C [Liparis tanakae]|uniref:Integral membrane protein GPR137C n=1 Tax=Liparis tanakae TaxID=230148 RepID=A0A4Z2G2Z3_9TELE|nr:Integral membrane protein GPR137C [Liparis tanakae]
MDRRPAGGQQEADYTRAQQEATAAPSCRGGAGLPKHFENMGVGDTGLILISFEICRKGVLISLDCMSPATRSRQLRTRSLARPASSFPSRLSCKAGQNQLGAEQRAHGARVRLPPAGPFPGHVLHHVLLVQVQQLLLQVVIQKGVGERTFAALEQTAPVARTPHPPAGRAPPRRERELTRRCLSRGGGILRGRGDVTRLEERARGLRGVGAEPQLSVAGGQRQHLVASDVEVAVILAYALAGGGNQERGVAHRASLSRDLYARGDRSAQVRGGLQRRDVRVAPGQLGGIGPAGGARHRGRSPGGLLRNGRVQLPRVPLHRPFKRAAMMLMWPTADVQEISGEAYVAFGIILFFWELLPTSLVVVFFRVQKPNQNLAPGGMINSHSFSSRAYFFDNPRRYDSDDDLSRSGNSRTDRASLLSSAPQPGSSSWYGSIQRGGALAAGGAPTQQTPPSSTAQQPPSSTAPLLFAYGNIQSHNHHHHNYYSTPQSNNHHHHHHHHSNYFSTPQNYYCGSQTYFCTPQN